jgi:hypothetical protein
MKWRRLVRTRPITPPMKSIDIRKARLYAAFLRPFEE